MSLKYSILVYEFPYGERRKKKMRPVLCLTEPTGKYNEVVLAYISTKIPQVPLVTDVVLKSDDAGFTDTKLTHPSVIRLHKLFTSPKAKVKGRLGKLSDNHSKQVTKALQHLFTL